MFKLVNILYVFVYLLAINSYAQQSPDSYGFEFVLIEEKDTLVLKNGHLSDTCSENILLTSRGKYIIQLENDSELIDSKLNVFLKADSSKIATVSAFVAPENKLVLTKKDKKMEVFFACETGIPPRAFLFLEFKEGKYIVTFESDSFEKYEERTVCNLTFYSLFLDQSRIVKVNK